MGVPLANLLAEKEHTVYITSRQERESSSHNIKYVKGNARNYDFITSLFVDTKYDAIVDFMHYTPKIFEQRLPIFLTHTNHYFFLSSCRVFLPTDNAITEDSIRLLDAVLDKKYLSTDEYALSKARCENILYKQEAKNWSIIRPYITYNEDRLQLGMFEKEVWLRRALSGKRIVLTKDMAEKRTTLTSGEDVAKIIMRIIENKACMGDAINIVSNESILWKDCLNIYLNVVEAKTGKRPDVVFDNNSYRLARIIGNTYKLKFDRLSNRMFNNNKINELFGNYTFEPAKIGLERCLSSFIDSKKNIANNNPVLEGYLDHCAKELTPLAEFKTITDKIKYLIIRFFPDAVFLKSKTYWVF